ncbi:MAG: ABC transporter permease [Ekhidna sp.]|nr:ABC transporter permease [Ekhidna sp.]
MIRPPKSAEKFLSWLIRPELLEEVLGDLYEYYEELSDHSPFRRAIYFWFHLFTLIRPSLLRSFMFGERSGYLGMIQLMLKTGVRQMQRKKLITVVSLVTLVAGVLSFQLVFSWIQNEKSMDEFHAKKDRISVGVARLSAESNLIAFSISGLFPIDYSTFSEVEKSMFIHTYMPGEIKFHSEEVAHGGKGLIVDSTFFDFFDFSLQSGSVDVLADPTNVVITESYADKIFGDKDPLGSVINITCDQKGIYKVAGIIEKIPSNTSISFDFLIPRHSKNRWRRAPQDFIMLKEGADLSAVNEKLNKIAQSSERFPNSEALLYPFKDVYENKPFNITLFSKYGSASDLRTVTLIAWALILITIICYTNLQTSVQLAEMDRVKLKHVIGAAKSHLVAEWLIRGLIYFAIASSISLLVYYTMFTTVIEFIGIGLDKHVLVDSLVIVGAVFISVLLSSLIASSNVFKTLMDLDVRKPKKSRPIGQPRRVLAVLQYAISITLLIGSVIITLQLDFMLDKDLGIDQTEIVTTQFFDVIPDARQDSIKRAEVESNHRYVMDRLGNHPTIEAVSQAKEPLGFAYDLPYKRSSSSEDFIPIKTLNADPDFFEIFDLQLAEGRPFDERDENGDLKLVINESAKKFFDIQDITQEKLISKIDNESYQIVGVIEDFHFEHLSQEIKPLIMTYFTRLDNDIMVK